MLVRLRKHKPMSFQEALRNPYAVKCLRKVIDASAFRIYGHWVKKAADQNRAALFENSTKADQRRLMEMEEQSSLRASPNLTLEGGGPDNDLIYYTTRVY